MLFTFALVWSLSAVCPMVERYRSQGLDDVSIEQIARANSVPERVISWAKRNCRHA